MCSEMNLCRLMLTGATLCRMIVAIDVAIVTWLSLVVGNEVHHGKTVSVRSNHRQISLLARVPLILLLTATLVTITGFSRNSQEDNRHGEQDESIAAIRQFWKVYHGNQYDQIPQVQQQLQNAIDRDPENSALYALLGATHFWHYGEYTRDSNPNLAVLQQDLPNAVDLFGKALDLDYYGKHLIGYVNDDHLPGYLGITTVHLGQQNSDLSTIQNGDEILDMAAYQFPEFNNFNRWAAHNTDQRDTDTYKKSLDSLWQALDACAAHISIGRTLI